MVVANQINRRWQYHHCLGSIDYKYVVIRKPMKAGSYYFNYNNFHSIDTMALVDGDYKFILVYVGSNGSSSDSQICEDWKLKYSINQDVIGFLPADHLPDDDKDTWYIFVCKNAFPIQTYMMKTYGRHGLEIPEIIYNYITNHCRRESENAFGILTNWFGCLLTPIKFQPNLASTVVLGAICCHNLMRMWYPAIQNAVIDWEDANNWLTPEEWRRGNIWEQELLHIPRNIGTKAGKQ